MRSWSAIASRIRVPLGFGFAIFYFFLAKPTWKSLIAGGAVCLPGLLLRAVASGYVQKNFKLTITGPYAYIRNPLYLGSMITAVGFALAGRSLWIVLGMAIIFAAVYVPVILAEERFLREQFPEFHDYEQEVPRLLPRSRTMRTSASTFSTQLYLQHREYNSFLGACAMMAALAAKMLWFQ